MSDEGEKKGAIPTAVIGAIAIILVAIISGFFQYGCNSKKNPQEAVTSSELSRTKPFNGIVTNADGEPVSKAQLRAAFDQYTPQIVLADTDGQFHLEVPVGTKTMHIWVRAEHFEPFDREVNPDRTGIEVMVLKASGVAAPTQEPKSKKRSEIAKKGSSPTAPPAVAPPSGSGSQSGGSGCTQNVGIGNGNINNCVPPPLQISPEQAANITSVIRASGVTGGEVDINFEYSAVGGRAIANILGSALSAAGIVTHIGEGSQMIGTSCGDHPVHPGLMFDCVGENEPLPRVVASALISSGVAPPPINATRRPANSSSSNFGIIIRKQ